LAYQAAYTSAGVADVVEGEVEEVEEADEADGCGTYGQ